MSRPCAVALVSPPWRQPSEPCLASALLGPILRGAGYPTTVIHGTLAWPDTSVDTLFMSSYAGHLFSPLLLEPEPRAAAIAGLVDILVERFAADLNLHGLIVPGRATLAQLERDEDAMRSWVAAQLINAERCVEAICEAIAARAPRVLALSATFEGQLVASLVIARRMRERHPDLEVVLGGAACFESAALSLVRHHPELDAVCFTEGEEVIVPLVRALLEGAPLAAVPGIAWRDGETARLNARPPSRRIDDNPFPDYGDYFEAHAESPWRELPPRLFVELSRGCWWGQKHLCTFCGLNAELLDFRAKSPERAYDELAHLHATYPNATRLAATDNILAMPYIASLLPRLEPLAAAPRPLRLFFEVKSNLRRDQLEALARAGIRHIQPGIESFSDAILALMKKGQTGLGQLQFIKHCAELGIDPSYNIIVMNPGEPTASYREMLPLIPAIDHLPPPDNVTPLWLERFSPYHHSPSAWQITALRPRAYYPGLYPHLASLPPHEAERALADLAYVFDYECAALTEEPHRDAVRTFALALGRWQYDWEPDRAFHRDDGHTVTLVDTRPGRAHEERLSPAESALHRWLDQVRPRSTLSAERFPDLDLDATLSRWRERGWVVTDNRDRWLATRPRARG